MSTIVFRHLPGIAAVERQLDLHARGHLSDEDFELLPHALDDRSRALFGITRGDTFYGALPASVTARFSRAGWESHFDVLASHGRDPNAHWRQFDLDLRCDRGSSLHCVEVFGRQLVCALNGLHPDAVLAFSDHPQPRAA